MLRISVGAQYFFANIRHFLPPGSGSASSTRIRIQQVSYNADLYLLNIFTVFCTNQLSDLAQHSYEHLMLLCRIICFRVQGAFARHIHANALRVEEICAGCLGLKKIKDFSVQSQILRHTLYKMLSAAESDPDLKVKTTVSLVVLMASHLKVGSRYRCRFFFNLFQSVK